MKFLSVLRSKRGFTLLELLVVIAIIGVLVGLATPHFLGYIKDAEVAGMKADAKVLGDQSLLYAIDNDDAYPVGGTPVTYDPVYVVTTNEVDQNVEAILEDLLLDKCDGITDAAAATTALGELNTAGAFVDLDATELASYVKSTKNPIGDYFIVVDPAATITGYAGELEGYVFSKTAKVDRAGTYWSGIYSVTP